MDQLESVGRAEALSPAGRLAEAAGAWAAVVRENPVNGTFWDRLASAWFALEDYEGALPAYRKAREFGVWGE
jgi:cytochrome c-type biogenesis protein CcmH/NrfG